MAEKTISFSPMSGGWTSFWSFIPDWMDGMNNTFYTWNNGSLYKHDSNNSRNQFYGVNYPSTITTIFNQEPTETKMFKTLELDSSDAWSANISTDLNTGVINSSQFINKEGNYFAYIRRADGDIDTRAISTQGIGSLLSYLSGTLTFNFVVSSSVSIGDTLYYIDNGSLVEIGVITSKTYNTLVVSTVVNIPSAGNIIVCVKNSVAESYGARGYYMEVTITNDSQDQVDIFEVSSNVFKSNP